MQVEKKNLEIFLGCLLYTSDAADEEDSVDLGGRRIIKKKSKYFTESFTRYCPCTLGACVHAHLEKFLDFSFQLA